MKRTEWKITAAAAVSSSAEQRLRSVTRSWASARQAYLTLIDAKSADVPALRLAARRLEDLERERRVLAGQLIDTHLAVRV